MERANQVPPIVGSAEVASASSSRQHTQQAQDASSSTETLVLLHRSDSELGKICWFVVTVCNEPDIANTNSSCYSIAATRVSRISEERNKF